MNLTSEPTIVTIYQSEGNNLCIVCIQKGMTFLHALQTTTFGTVILGNTFWKYFRIIESIKIIICFSFKSFVLIKIIKTCTKQIWINPKGNCIGSSEICLCSWQVRNEWNYLKISGILKVVHKVLRDDLNQLSETIHSVYVYWSPAGLKIQDSKSRNWPDSHFLMVWNTIRNVFHDLHRAVVWSIY